MKYYITYDCIACAACVDTCPVQAIKEYRDRYQIDENICVGCGACADSCPVDAIRSN